MEQDTPVVSDPFSEGFLDTIVAVQWRKGKPASPFVWVSILIIGPQNISISGVSFDVDFALPSKFGGTPGRKLIISSEPNSDFPTAPHTVTEADLTAPFPMDGGLPTIGFGVRKIQFTTPVTDRSVEVFLVMDPKQFSGTVPIHINYKTTGGSGIGDHVQFIVSTVPKNVYVPGFVIGDDNPGPGGGDTGLYATLNTVEEKHVTFTINTKTLKVVAPPPG